MSEKGINLTKSHLCTFKWDSVSSESFLRFQEKGFTFLVLTFTPLTITRDVYCVPASVPRALATLTWLIISTCDRQLLSLVEGNWGNWVGEAKLQRLENWKIGEQGGNPGSKAPESLRHEHYISVLFTRANYETEYSVFPVPGLAKSLTTAG